jgi:hypothetical protein
MHMGGTPKLQNRRIDILANSREYWNAMSLQMGGATKT